ncbi:MAG TPA: hypothetical protein VF453_09610 [Burkholderiaceae bacterium]
MSEERQRARAGLIAACVAAAVLAFAVAGLAYVASYFSRFHTGWR